ncbi:phage Gp37/Gp68 family protein [Paracoccus sp. TOH]|uniref:phage Gp37/Gp68 family protein n=1 Tax=Paracoccus sp. TOH TaxID=1263728 RepID=UPI0025B1C866|nr:phage Gp37/Gp68 family protein [Paracoccus sp. TOH]WJS86739.1 phage Gp37/Gp68 family protein [Paracoccus sp. TOH]
MAENSRIEWTHHTFNPWIGCQKVGPGCDHCYAEAWDSRGLQQRETRWGPHAARTRTSAANWRKPLAWDRAAAAAGERHRVFCASLADVFDNHASILPEWRDDLWRLIEATPNLDWMLLTKRPGNIANMLPVPFDFERLYPNVWLGCTVVNQAEADRDIPKLLAVPAAVRFLSMEPLLGPTDLTRLMLQPGGQHRNALTGHTKGFLTDYEGSRLDLVIVGGESGPGARPMHPEWARSLRDQCTAAGVAFHFKQWGEWAPSTPEEATGNPRSGWRCLAGHPHVPKAAELYPEAEAAFIERKGKKAAGRLLEGRTWDEMPGVRS